MMNQEDRSAGHATKGHISVAKFTSKEWNNSTSFSMLAFFFSSVVFAVLGLVVALILMIFLPDMRSFYAVALFSAAFGMIFGFMLQKSEQARMKNFLADLSSRININLTELCGSELQNITPSQLEKLIHSGQDHPLTVDGIAGLHLMVREDRGISTASTPASKSATSSVTDSHHGEKSRPSSKCWHVMIATEVPPYGTESFDRLLDAATRNGNTER